MILETQQNWFHNFWLTTQFLLNLQVYLRNKIRKCLEKEKGPAATPSGPTAQRGMWPTCETAHGGEPAMALYQMRPRTFPEPRLAPNTISSFL